MPCPCIEVICCMVFITIKKVHEMGLDYRLALEQSLVSCYQISYCNFFFRDCMFRRSMHSIKEFRLQCLKFRIASSNLWRSINHGAHLTNFLLSAARSLFQQVVLFCASILRCYLSESYNCSWTDLLLHYSGLFSDDLCS